MLYELSEQIDSTLENSLDEYYKVSDLKDFQRRKYTDKEKETAADVAKAQKPTINILKGKGGASAQSLLAKTGVDDKLKTAILRALKADFEEAGFNALEEAKRETVSLQATLQVLDDITDPTQKFAVQKALITFLRKSDVRLDSETSKKLKTGFAPGVRPVGPSPKAMKWAIGWREGAVFKTDAGEVNDSTRLTDLNLYSVEEVRQKIESWPEEIQYFVLGFERDGARLEPIGWKKLEDVPTLLRPADSSTVSEGQEPADDLVEVVIDLEELKEQGLNESFLAMFGGWVEQILGSMFDGKSLPVSVKGSRRDVESFAKTLNGEKSYLEAARQYGLDHPTTYKNKAKLENAIKGFEKDTGIKWPFK